ncbi:MAG: sugar isomerase [Spirochaetaceae bacterium]
MATGEHSDNLTTRRVGLLLLGRKRPGFDPDWGAEIKKRLRAYAGEAPFGVTIPSDNIADDAGVRAALAECEAAGVDTVVVTQPTISDGRLAPVLAQVWNRPLVLWATPEKEEGSMISANSLVGTHVMAATLRHLNRPFEFVYGDPGDSAVRGRLEEAVRLVVAATDLRRGKVALVGYHAPGFVDFHADPIDLNDELGVQLYHESVQEFLGRVENQKDDAVAAEVSAFESLGLPYRDADESALPLQARYYLAMQEYLTNEASSALAFRDWPDLPTVMKQWPYLALARHVSEGKAIAMEGDVDGALCSLIAEDLGIGPVYLSDWLEHDARHIGIWHTGAAPFELCEPVGTELGPHIGVQFNNRLPAVVEATIKADMPVTIFRMWRTDGFYHMTALEGRTVTPKRHIMATNGLAEITEVDVNEWFEEMLHAGMPHHMCVVQGHHRGLLQKLARQLRIGWR